ncbi:hypothetical protein [Tateyamaria sp.]|uniref:hypothetical protein n=1 Tax=Tateyamaria sp. TaxID=1929288 RepID=UPI00329CF75B
MHLAKMCRVPGGGADAVVPGGGVCRTGVPWCWCRVWVVPGAVVLMPGGGWWPGGGWCVPWCRVCVPGAGWRVLAEAAGGAV